MVFADREAAEDVADQLLDDGEFASVRVVSEALAGEDDAEDVDWVVHVMLESDSSENARTLAERFTELAEKHGGWLDEDWFGGE